MVQGFIHKELLTQLTTIPGLTNHSLKYFHDEAFHRQMFESQNGVWLLILSCSKELNIIIKLKVCRENVFCKNLFAPQMQMVV